MNYEGALNCELAIFFSIKVINFQLFRNNLLIKVRTQIFGDVVQPGGNSELIIERSWKSKSVRRTRRN